MTALKEPIPEVTPEIASWEVELQKVGFVRRILNARRWYGADWWFVVVSAILVLVFIAIALFPDLFAPYRPDAMVGPSFLAPGVHPPIPVLVVPTSSSINTLKDLAVATGQPRPAISVVQGGNSSSALNDAAQALDNQIKNEPAGLRLRPVIDRYPTVQEAATGCCGW